MIKYPRSYRGLAALLSKKKRYKDFLRISKTVYAQRDPDSGNISIFIHWTGIVEFFPDGRRRVSTSGWDTNTTVKWMNTFLPSSVRAVAVRQLRGEVCIVPEPTQRWLQRWQLMEVPVYCARGLLLDARGRVLPGQTHLEVWREADIKRVQVAYRTLQAAFRFWEKVAHEYERMVGVLRRIVIHELSGKREVHIHIPHSPYTICGTYDKIAIFRTACIDPEVKIRTFSDGNVWERIRNYDGLKRIFAESEEGLALLALSALP